MKKKLLIVLATFAGPALFLTGCETMGDGSSASRHSRGHSTHGMP